MRLIKSVIAALFVVSVFGAMSCATSPKKDAGPATASLRFLTETELKRNYGPTYEENPFLPPSSLVTGTPKDYAVLELTMRLPYKSKIEIDANITGLKGKAAEIMTARSLFDYISIFSLGSPSEKARRQTIERFCVPGTTFTSNPGKGVYYIVVACEHPYPDDAHITAQVYINGELGARLDEQLPPPPVKKSLFNLH